MTAAARDRERAGHHLCAVCGPPRPALAVEAGDPYYSARCAKRAHGVRDSLAVTGDQGDATPGKPLQQRRRVQRVWRRTFHAWAEWRMNLQGAREDGKMTR